jgi:hypothetical protein
MAYNKSAQSFIFSLSVCRAKLKANERSNGVERRCFCANDDIICETFVTFMKLNQLFLLRLMYFLTDTNVGLG